MWETTKEFFGEILLPLLMILSIMVILIIGPIMGFCYYGSCKQANIYNEQNNTEYTCSDFFWASEQINQQTQTIKLSR